MNAYSSLELESINIHCILIYVYIYIYTCIDISFWRICVTKIQRNNETCVGLLTCFSGLTALGLYAAPGVGACTRTEGLERGRGDDPMKYCWRPQNPGANDIYCWWFRNPKADHLGCISFVNNGINYLSTGAGFQPSTVGIQSVRTSDFKFRKDTPLKKVTWNIIVWRFGSDHFPFFSWVMA